MVKVAFCESTHRHYTDTGVLRGTVDNRDTGVFQINTHYWLDRSIELEHDIFTLEGNIAMARYIYDKYGTRPWYPSEPCWNA